MEPLSSDHAAAIHDSVAAFVETLDRFLSSFPAGDSAVAAGRAYYADDVIYSGDVAPEEPVLLQGYAALTAGAERPAWLRDFEFRTDTSLITPLAAGLATVSAVYRERWIDTTGAETRLSGAVLLVVRHDSGGWRIVSQQAAHPSASMSRYEALLARFTPKTP